MLHMMRVFVTAVLFMLTMAEGASASRGRPPKASPAQCAALMSHAGAGMSLSGMLDLIDEELGPAPDPAPAAPSAQAALLGGSPRRAAAKGARRASSAQPFTISSRARPAEGPEALFAALADRIREKEPEIRAALSRFNNAGGTDFEVNQVLRMLDEAALVEASHYRHTRRLKAVAVYGSTNVPLYTLVAHGFMSTLLGGEVRFRTPGATREVYGELFALLKDGGVVEEAASRLRVLTENRDVQYENFRKMHVLGLNRNGTRVVNDPADLVLFTGSPETGRRVLADNVKKMNELSEMFGDRTVLFLGFGAGMNPVIVTPDAAANLDQVTDLILEPVRINMAQDCMVPDFYAVHRSVADRLFTELQRKIAALRPGATSDPSAGFSPLTYSTDWKGLAAYREQHGARLLNPAATFDEGQLLVAPHIFRFAASDFATTDLREHYAPFFSFFVYDSPEDLVAMARDPRVQKKAMYASVYGGKRASEYMTRAVRIFQENRHAVTVNATLFGESEGAIPFGGRGSDASMIATLRLRTGHPVEVQMAHAPTLVSEEAYFTFGDEEAQPKAPLRPQSYFQSQLAELLRRASGPASAIADLDESWRRFEADFDLTPVSDTQWQAAADAGLWQIYSGPRPRSKAALEALEKFHGTKLLFVGEGTDAGVVPGLLLQPADVGGESTSLMQGRGLVNPHRFRGLLLPLVSDKYSEYLITEAVQPGFMAKTETYGSLAEAGVLAEEWIEAKAAFKSRLTAASRRGSFTDDERRALSHELQLVLRRFFHAVRGQFPEGAFFKNFGDFGTADLGTQVTSFSTSPKSLAGQFLRRFETTMVEGGSRVRRGGFGSGAFQEALASDPWEMGTKFVLKLLTDPDRILVQSRVRIARTEQGFKREFRVELVQGRVVYAKTRFTHEYDPEGCAEAERVVREFFARAPEALRTLSGGVDVAQLRDGRWVVMEYNFGSASGTYAPGYFPIQSNELMSRLQGRPTALIQELRALAAQPLAAQQEFLRSRPVQKEKWWKQGLGDISAYEYARWLRDERLRRWRSGEDPRPVAEVLADIEAMLSVLGEECREEAGRLLEGAVFYVKRVSP